MVRNNFLWLHFHQSHASVWVAKQLERIYYMVVHPDVGTISGVWQVKLVVKTLC